MRVYVCSWAGVHDREGEAQDCGKAEGQTQGYSVKETAKMR